MRGRANRKRRTNLHGRPLGIADARIKATPGFLATQGKRGRLGGGDVPGMPEIEIGEIVGEQVGIG